MSTFRMIGLRRGALVFLATAALFGCGATSNIQLIEAPMIMENPNRSAPLAAVVKTVDPLRRPWYRTRE